MDIVRTRKTLVETDASDNIVTLSSCTGERARLTLNGQAEGPLMIKDRFTLNNHAADSESLATSTGSEPKAGKLAKSVDFALGIGLDPNTEEFIVPPPSPAQPTPLHDAERVEYGITVFRPVGEVYSFWRDFSNIPKFMTHVRDIELLDGGERVRWYWTTLGGFEFQWDTTLIDDVPDKLLSWKTTPGSAAQHAGSIWFKPVLDGEATEVYLRFVYKIPGGRLTTSVAGLFGEAPNQVFKNDLRRFRCLLETGIAPDFHGRRANH